MTVTVGTQSPDDREHCFKSDSRRRLYFKVTTEIASGRAYVDLYKLGDLSKEPVWVESGDAEIKNNIATVSIEGHSTRSSAGIVEHLGPGPYIATVSASTSVRAADRLSAGYAGGLRYYYETWRSNQNECSP